MSLLLDDLSVQLDGKSIVSGVTFDVAARQWVALIGPNGAGKSTILRSVMGLHPHTGRISFGEAPLETMSRRQRARRVAYVPQDPVRPSGMRVRDYVMLGRTPHLTPLGKESHADESIVGQVLASLAIDSLAHRDVSTLSGGEAQRAVIARAVAQQPSLLIMDEPTSALDLAAQLDVMETIDALRQQHGIGVLSTTHDLTLAARFVDVVHMVAKGRIVESGTPTEVLTVEKIATHYGAEVQVLTDPTGGLIVAPRRSPRRPR